MGGLPDVIGDNEGGVLVDIKSNDAVQATQRLLSDCQYSAAQSDAARTRIVNCFRLDIHTRKCLDLYQSVNAN